LVQKQASVFEFRKRAKSTADERPIPQVFTFQNKQHPGHRKSFSSFSSPLRAKHPPLTLLDCVEPREEECDDIPRIRGSSPRSARVFEEDEDFPSVLDKRTNRSQSVSEYENTPPRHGLIPDAMMDCKGVDEGILPVKKKQLEGFSLKLVSIDVVAELLLGKYHQKLDQYFIVDCRFDYEFNGGHIRNAVHLGSRQSIEHFYQEANKIVGAKKVAIIFHCEFSKNRGPRSCRYFREIDRSSNKYPNLIFPELCIMDGGYKFFFYEVSTPLQPIQICVHVGPCIKAGMQKSSTGIPLQLVISEHKGKTWSSTSNEV